MYSNCQY